MINCFNNMRDPNVRKEIDIYDFLDKIKKPEPLIIQKIETARNYYSLDKEKYNFVKAQLPCFTLNFSFRDRKLNKNIKESTGFIYIDIDGTTDIDLNNEYIFASWLSLSGTGRGVLVKVNELTFDNFKYTYKNVSNLLCVKADSKADKATQYCVHSYDENIYVNEYSKTYQSEKIEKNSPITDLKKKERRKVNSKMGEKRSLRFNNINDYDFKGEDYIVFWENKELISEVYVPRLISEGKRESCLSSMAHQYKALNTEITEEELSHFIHSVNSKRCFPPLKEEEVNKIVKSKIGLSYIVPMPNKERRILFNPEKTFSRLEKVIQTNQVLGMLRMEKSQTIIRNSITNWDFNILGRITQKKLAQESGLNVKTIQKHYPIFKKEIMIINKKKSGCNPAVTFGSLN